jgi:hypothetical protein
VATKSLPLVGLGIGAGWNWVEASAVGRRAIAYHTGHPIAEQKLATLGRRLIAERWRALLPGAKTRDEEPPG